MRQNLFLTWCHHMQDVNIHFKSDIARIEVSLIIHPSSTPSIIQSTLHPFNYFYTLSFHSLHPSSTSSIIIHLAAFHSKPVHFFLPSHLQYLSSADDRLSWQACSLPSDDLCTENAIMLNRFNRYSSPLFHLQPLVHHSSTTLPSLLYHSSTTLPPLLQHFFISLLFHYSNTVPLYLFLPPLHFSTTTSLPLHRYPLIIDPSGQATEFILSYYKDKKITKTRSTFFIFLFFILLLLFFFLFLLPLFLLFLLFFFFFFFFSFFPFFFSSFFLLFPSTCLSSFCPLNLFHSTTSNHQFPRRLFPQEPGECSEVRQSLAGARR